VQCGVLAFACDCVDGNALVQQKLHHSYTRRGGR
jgi:hypothetical protein